MIHLGINSIWKWVDGKDMASQMALSGRILVAFCKKSEFSPAFLKKKLQIAT